MKFLEVEGNVNKRERHAAQAHMLPHAGPWFRNVVQQWLPLLIFAALGRVAEHECPTPASDAASMRFTPWSYSRRKASQKISDAENARAVSQYRLEAGRIIQVSSYYFRAQLLERFRRFRIRTSREAAHLRLA